MPTADFRPDQVRGYAPERAEPADLDAFWASTLTEAAALPLAASFTPVATGLRLISVFDVSFAGYGGSEVRGWLHLPAAHDGPLPCVVQYVGYGGGRGLAHENLLWAAAGYAHLIMDTRGQGSGWSVGHTGDPDPGSPAHPGFMTRGILDPAAYYYRRLFVDAVRAVDVAAGHPAVAPDQIFVTGRSQGGGLAIAVAGLRGNLAGAMPDVPFLSAFPRALEVAERGPYLEIVNYLKVHRDQVDAAMRTLAYFDAAALSRRATAPALFSVALRDAICPPSTVYAAYNNYAGPKDIREYAYNDHEGGEAFQQEEQLRWAAARLAAAG
jgi:cephalosporin-C deacetylase